MVNNFLFPLAILCGLIGILVLVGIFISYLSLRWFYSEISKCPECGRRGAGEFLGSEVVESTSSMEHRNTLSLFGGNPSQRVRISETTHEERYRCEYCGHEWTKTARQKTSEPVD
jgi:ribosomal protein L37AE/L43A